jgi:hypothetical protein
MATAAATSRTTVRRFIRASIADTGYTTEESYTTEDTEVQREDSEPGNG